jgi:hypothetical protein
MNVMANELYKMVKKVFGENVYTNGLGLYFPSPVYTRNLQLIIHTHILQWSLIDFRLTELRKVANNIN